MNDIDDDDWEPDEWEADDDSSSDTMFCPICHQIVYEDTPRCPVCGNYLPSQTSIWANKPRWVRSIAWILLVLAVLGFLFAEFRFIF